VEACRAAMIVEFLKRGGGTWEEVLTSLRSAGYIDLAYDIEKQLNAGSIERPLTQS